jgi:cation diffusion facilitator CzcD-associated flavoprotein CzcO
MVHSQPAEPSAGRDEALGRSADSTADHTVLVIGAGLTGICQLYRLLEAGVDAMVVEAHPDLGGTWYRNRYPGCRFDSESYTYGYSFSPELLAEWDWSEHFSGQPENLRYLNHVADKFDLRPHMRFDCRVDAATWDEDSRTWTLHLAGGERLTCRFLMTAVGVLSTPTMPRVEGIDSFQGPWFHTYDWPQEPVELAGRRVAVIGTGATAVQLIAEIADKVGHLTVFQRHPNWCAPLHNRPIDDAEMADIRSRYDEIFELCRQTPGGFIHNPLRQPMFDVPEEERHAFFEELYASSGFRIWQGNFRDVLMNEAANEEFTAFVADKIRERVKDPVLAEKLIPTDHGFGTRRVPMETNYYEAFNRDNVELVDLIETPIERITPTGILTTGSTGTGATGRHHEVDLIVYATGFDAMTGAFDRIDFTGVDGTRLRERWAEGPETYLGIQSVGFPNLLILAGPQSGSGFTNFGRGVEEVVDWTTALLQHLRSNGHTRIEPTPEAQAGWCQHVRDMYDLLLLGKVRSWFTGYNSNVEGHDRQDAIRHVVYNGGAPRYRKHLTEVADQDYAGFLLC